MTNEFVPYELALKLKQLGFDEPCFGWYEAHDHEEVNLTYSRNSEGWLDGLHCSAPLFQQAFRWFRKEHSLGHMINGIGYESFLMNAGGIITVFPLFFTYQEAELACLDKLIEIVTKQQEQ